MHVRTRSWLSGILWVVFHVGCGMWWSTPAAASPVEAAGNTDRPLPAATAKTLEDGLAAAERGDFPAAVRLFDQVRQAVPDDPAALYYLARARQALGHQLAAIAWYRAFLAAAPDARVVPEARRCIVHLEAANERRARELVDIEVSRIGELEALDDRRFQVSVWTTHDKMARILAATSRDARGRQLTAEELGMHRHDIVTGFLDAGMFDAAVANYDPRSDFHSTLAIAIFQKQAAAGDYAGAQSVLRLVEQSDGGWHIAKAHIQAGNVDAALEYLAQRVHFVHEATEGRAWLRTEDPESAELLRKASPAAIRHFIETRGKNESQGDLYTLIAAMARWGYLAEAERAASLIEDSEWRAAAEIDIIDARAGLREITRDEQAEHLNSMVDRHAHRSVAMWSDILSRTALLLADQRIDSARKLADFLLDNDTSKSRGHARVLASHRYWPNESVKSRVLRMLMEAEADAGDFEAARRTSEELLRVADMGDSGYDKTVEFFLAAADPAVTDFEHIFPDDTCTFNDNALARAAKIRARRGDFASAKKIAQLSSPRFYNSWHVKSLAAIAAAQFHQGDEASARETLRDILASMDADLICSTRGSLVLVCKALNLPEESRSPDAFATIAAELAEVHDVQGLRELAHYVTHTSGGQSLECLCQKLSQLQRSVGDFEGAQRTLECSRGYARALEVADWSAVALALENSPLRYVDHFSEFRDEARGGREEHAALEAAGHLLRIQHAMRERDARWQQRRGQHASKTPP